MTSATDFVERWTERAHECDDCFDTFFSAWIALVIEARRHLDENQMAHPDTDRIAVIQYFDARADSVTTVLDQLAEAKRQTPATARPTAATAPLEQLPAELQEHWRKALSQTGGIELVVRCRAALERTTEHLLRSGTGTAPSRTGLVEGIKALQEQGRINSVATTHMHTIRTLGNEAAHRGGIGEDEVAACRTAAVAIIKVVVGITSKR